MPNLDRSPDDALRALADRLIRVEFEKSIETSECTNRVLAADVFADRDSPAADVSAMDGFAIRLSDLQTTDLISISGESVPGSPPPLRQAGCVVRIFTGAIVPEGAEAVVKREDTEELGDVIRFRESAMQTRGGENIRHAGENAKANSVVLSAGVVINAAQLASMTNFGCLRVNVFSPVRVSIVTTGDEVGSFVNQRPEPWQLRNSNGAALNAVLTSNRWISIVRADHCRDDRQALTELLRDRLSHADAIVITGGVSMGDYDHVPDVVRDVGGEVVFHGLPIRPGKPILGAATSGGKLIVGLPGNPVSAIVGAVRMVLPLLAKISGQTVWQPPRPTVRLENGGDKTLPLFWMRLVRLTDHGIAEPVISQGSGDLVSLGQSSGFVELPPGEHGEGPWPYFAWR